MAKRTVRRRRSGANPDDPTQETRILRALERWADAAPGRRFTLERTVSGWTARLDETQSATGSTMLDAAAQIAVAAAFATPAPDEGTP